MIHLTVNKINRVKNEVGGKSSELLAYMQVFDFKEAFTLRNFVFLPLDANHSHLDFKDILSPAINN